MKNKLLYLSLILVIASSLFLASCETSATAPHPYTIIEGSIDSTFTPVQLDEVTTAMVIIDDTEAEINKGQVFYSYDVTDLGNGANRTIMLIPAAGTGRTHFYWEVNNELEARIEIFESATVSNNGTAMPVYNRDRNSALVNTTLIRHTPTVTSYGTLIYEVQLGSGKQAGGVNTPLRKLILQAGTRYLMIITNQTTSSNVVSGEMIWEEYP